MKYLSDNKMCAGLHANSWWWSGSHLIVLIAASQGQPMNGIYITELAFCIHNLCCTYVLVVDFYFLLMCMCCCNRMGLATGSVIIPNKNISAEHDLSAHNKCEISVGKSCSARKPLANFTPEEVPDVHRRDVSKPNDVDVRSDDNESSVSAVVGADVTPTEVLNKEPIVKKPPPVQRFCTRGMIVPFQYGNYLQYYGYRNPDHATDIR